MLHTANQTFPIFMWGLKRISWQELLPLLFPEVSLDLKMTLGSKLGSANYFHLSMNTAESLTWQLKFVYGTIIGQGYRDQVMGNPIRCSTHMWFCQLLTWWQTHANCQVQMPGAFIPMSDFQILSLQHCFSQYLADRSLLSLSSTLGRNLTAFSGSSTRASQCKMIKCLAKYCP